MPEIKFTTSKDKTEELSFKKHAKHIITAIVAILVLIVLFNGFAIVEEGYVGVKYCFGKIVSDDLSAGLNFKIPFIEEIKKVDIREQIYAISTDAYTSDTQSVKPIELKLNYCYDRSKLSNIIRNIGVANVETKLLVPNVQKIAKDAIGKVKAEQLVQSRAVVTEEIQNALTTILAKDGILVTAFAIENIYFDSAFEAAIQAKVIAEQDALKMQNKTKEKNEEAKQVLIAAQAQADSKKLAAEAEAAAIKLIQEQLAKSPNYVDYLKVDRWNGELPQVVSDGVNPFVALNSASNAAAKPETGTQ